MIRARSLAAYAILIALIAALVAVVVRDPRL